MNQPMGVVSSAAPKLTSAAPSGTKAAMKGAAASAPKPIITLVTPPTDSISEPICVPKAESRSSGPWSWKKVESDWLTLCTQSPMPVAISSRLATIQSAMLSAMGPRMGASRAPMASPRPPTAMPKFLNCASAADICSATAERSKPKRAKRSCASRSPAAPFCSMGIIETPARPNSSVASRAWSTGFSMRWKAWASCGSTSEALRTLPSLSRMAMPRRRITAARSALPPVAASTIERLRRPSEPARVSWLTPARMAASFSACNWPIGTPVAAARSARSSPAAAVRTESAANPAPAAPRPSAAIGPPTITAWRASPPSAAPTPPMDAARRVSPVSRERAAKRAPMTRSGPAVRSRTVIVAWNFSSMAIRHPWPRSSARQRAACSP